MCLTVAGGFVVGEEATAFATAIVCTGVQDRAPVGAAESFPSDIGQLYCFSDVRNGGNQVVHVWYHNDREVRRIELAVKGTRWRTWSAKTIPSSSTGSWKVEVQTPDGTVLAASSFVVE
jgi:hypothetical protein